MEYLSNTELYFFPVIRGKKIFISGEEKKHISKVMRHSSGETLYVTDGEGNIYLGRISNISNESIELDIETVHRYENIFKNYFFCIPKLKNPERFEFALEKCTEMGIVNFIIYNAIHSVTRGDRKERWEKITIAAMKQSLLSFKPRILYIDKLTELNKFSGNKIILEQNAQEYISKEDFMSGQNIFFIFGPEGGLDQKEINSLNDIRFLKLSLNRLRTETAILKTASILTSF